MIAGIIVGLAATIGAFFFLRFIYPEGKAASGSERPVLEAVKHARQDLERAIESMEGDLTRSSR